MAIADFLLHLEERSDVSSIIDPSTNTRVPVKLIDMANQFNLPNEGGDPLKVGIRIDDEYRRFSVKEDADWFEKK